MGVGQALGQGEVKAGGSESLALGQSVRLKGVQAPAAAFLPDSSPGRSSSTRRETEGTMPRFTISNRQRAPIYEQLRRHLANIDDVRVLADADPEEAGRRALEYADDFRLFEDLGWDRHDPRDSIRLTMPPVDLRRALMRLQGEAEGELTSSAEAEREEKAEHAEIREESVAAREACRDLLDALDTELEGRRQQSACT